MSLGILAASGTTYLPLGAKIPVSRALDLVVAGTFTRGDWYTCSTTSAGGWLELGTAFADDFNPSGRGLFFEPKLVARWFRTSGGQTSAPGWFGSGCTANDLTTLQQTDAELHVGGDLGYVISRKWVFVAFEVGVHFGACFNCIGTGAFFWGDPSVSIDLGSNEPLKRTDHATLGLNLNLLRLGAAF